MLIQSLLPYEIENTVYDDVLYSNFMYPDLVSNKRIYKKVRTLSDLERSELLGEIGVKFVAKGCVIAFNNKLYYQNDSKVYILEFVNKA